MLRLLLPPRALSTLAEHHVGNSVMELLSLTCKLTAFSSFVEEVDSVTRRDPLIPLNDVSGTVARRKSRCWYGTTATLVTSTC